ncbi:MAG: hypothetical protein C0518_04235 [Opitutus sp.]|nr:hypothetical protein [Opitutus sp.]
MNRFFLLFLVTAGAGLAQPSATMRPELLATVESNASFSSDEDLARGSAVLGQVGVRQYGVSVAARRPWNESTTLIFGAAVNVHDLELSSPLLPLPEDLSEFSLNLGVQRRFDARWSGAAYLRPGFYGDFEEGLSSDSFNAPLLVMAMFAQSRELVWSFGLNVNGFSDNPVLPIAGVRWQFAPQWLFSVGFPRTGFAYELNDRLTLRAGASFSGGSFRLSRNLGVPAPGIARLSRTFLDFREVRVGVGADYAFTEQTSLSLDVGAVTDRKFDYFDKNYRLDGDGGLFVALALKGSF